MCCHLLGCSGLAETKESGAVQHGETQVRRMLGDRLQMNVFNTESGQRYLEIGDEICSLAARHFSMKPGNMRVFWDSRNPNGSMRADRSIGFYGEVLSVRVRDQGDRLAPENAFEEMWSGFFYEMLGYERRVEMFELRQKAKQRAVTRDEFIKKCARHEYQILIDLEDFWTKHWKPWAEKNGFLTDQSSWFMRGPGDFEHWFQRQRAVVGGMDLSEYLGLLGGIYDLLIESKVKDFPIE